MQARPNPRRRLVLAHLEYATGRLDLGPGAPSGDEGSGKRRIREVDRDRVIQNATGAPAAWLALRTNYGHRIGIELHFSNRSPDHLHLNLRPRAFLDDCSTEMDDREQSGSILPVV